jgi:hypothetical protein
MLRADYVIGCAELAPLAIIFRTSAWRRNGRRLIKHQDTAKGFDGVEADMDDSCADETVPRSGSTI